MVVLHMTGSRPLQGIDPSINHLEVGAEGCQRTASNEILRDRQRLNTGTVGVSNPLKQERSKGKFYRSQGKRE